MYIPKAIPIIYEIKLEIFGINVILAINVVFTINVVLAINVVTIINLLLIFPCYHDIRLLLLWQVRSSNANVIPFFCSIFWFIEGGQRSDGIRI
jgi:hypothetical protein